MPSTKPWRELRERSKVSPEQRARTDAAVKKEIERLDREAKIEKLRSEIGGFCRTSAYIKFATKPYTTVPSGD